MPIIFLPFLLLSAIFAAEAQQAQSIIKPGSFLTPTTNSSWLSRSGLYAFGFYKQGNGYAIGIFFAALPQKTVVWTADRDKPPVPADSKLNFTSDGRLVLQSVQGTQTSLASFPTGASSASMLDSGNFVLYNSTNQTVWQSFGFPTDTFLPTQNLSHGQVLYSSVSYSNQSTGIFRLLMQEDGWLSLYPVGTPYAPFEYGYWGAGVSGQKTNDVVLQLDDDGHLYLVNGAGAIIVNMTSAGTNPSTGAVYRLTIDPDGMLKLYSHNMNQNGNWTFTWSAPDNKCYPKGLCGFNAYCIVIDVDFGCNCLPGFARVNEDDPGSGCERNFTAESCKSNKAISEYTMQTVPNTVWENDNYSVLISPSQENCGEACLQDCNCDAALFKGGECTKQRLPLRFGRRDQSDSTVALIKVSTSTSTSTDTILPKETKIERRQDVLIIGVSLVAFALIVLAISGIAIYRNRVWSYKMISDNGNAVVSEDFAPKSFTYAQLEKVTGGFKEEIGKGVFGTVYKGAISNAVGERLVAVKRLDKLLAEREREFHTEIKVIGRTHHKNLVRLLGYCHDGPNRLLVYEYMSNGSLADILFTPEKQLSWNERIEIARNIARGILYLHEECEPQIIHCDIKPQNILIDENRRPKISDFGLSKLLKVNQSRTFTDIRGTKGYVAPEWHRKLPVTVKVDVYSFGIVLLEIISGRKSVDYDLPEEEAILEEWTYQCFESGELGRLVNNEEIDKKQLERIVKIGLWCILDESLLRHGFCAVTYLSLAPQGLKRVLLTGGIPPIGNGCTADTVYRACFEQVMLQNEKYYKRYPQDIEIVREVVNYLAESEGGGVLLPSGGILTPKGLQTLGLYCLGTSAGFERLHYMLEGVWDPVIVPGAPKRISYYFLNAFEKSLAFDTNPLYALLHESIYCQGASSRWSAHRIRLEYEEKFDAIKASKGCPVLFTGEMIFPWMFDEIHALRQFKDVAHILAEKEDWPPVYDTTVLNNNKVPVAAAVYYEDMFVNFKLAMETASQIAGIRLWITNEYMHSGLRDGGGRVFEHLMGILNGKKPLF